MLITNIISNKVIRDFTPNMFKKLLIQFSKSDYLFLSFEQFCTLKKEKKLPHKFIILRHDVDKDPYRSFIIAKVENELRIQASYYFRTTNISYNPLIMKSIIRLKHELGYHYEDYNNKNGILEHAAKSFKKNLFLFRELYPIKTVSMHGNPSAKYDEGLLWNYLNTTKLGLLGEPYHSIDFNTVFYLTDTGRRWDGYKVSVWDKVPQQELWQTQGLSFHSTRDILKALTKNQFPNQVMITTHPQRWTNSYSAWFKELIIQYMKNIVKRVLNVLKSRIPKLFNFIINRFN